MQYTVSSLWAIYVIVVVVAFLLFWLLLGPIQRNYQSVSYGCAFFMASFIGAMVVFIGAAWLNSNHFDSTQKNWMSALYLVAFLLPMLVILFVCYRGEYASLTGEEGHVVGWYNSSQIKCNKRTGQCVDVEVSEEDSE